MMHFLRVDTDVEAKILICGDGLIEIDGAAAIIVVVVIAVVVVGIFLVVATIGIGT